MKKPKKGEQGTFSTVGGNIFDLLEEKKGGRKGVKKKFHGCCVTKKEEDDEEDEKEKSKEKTAIAKVWLSSRKLNSRAAMCVFNLSNISI